MLLYRAKNKEICPKNGFLSLGAAKNSSKNISHKTAEATGELIGKETAKKL